MADAMHQRLLAYREAARHLWNTCFEPRVTPEDAGLLLDVFDRIRSLLFESMTAHPLEAGSATQGAVPIEVAVRAHCAIMVSRERTPDGYWDHAVRDAGASGVRGAFVDFFDWDHVGPRDFAFCRLQITVCAEHPELVGHHCLARVADLAFRRADAAS